MWKLNYKLAYIISIAALQCKNVLMARVRKWFFEIKGFRFKTHTIESS